MAKTKQVSGLMMRHWRALAVGTLAAALLSSPAGAQQAGDWIGTWAASPQPVWAADFPVPINMPRNLIDQTFRQVVHISMGGNELRVKLSNRYGNQPLVIGAATVALAGIGSAIDAGSVKTLTFGGQDTVTIPPGAPVVSDPVALSVPNGGNLTVSLFLPDTTPLSTVHWEGVQTAYISGPGNHTADPEIKPIETIRSRIFLSEIFVNSAPGTKAVVTFGDSITDGANSTPDADHRWPDFLAARLRQAGDTNIAVLDEGISGAKVLTDRMGVNALARFDQDVLDQPHASTVILLMGINDIGWPGCLLAPNDPEPTAAAIIDGYKQLIARAHLHGLRIIGATLTPFGGAFNGTPFQGYYSAAKEAVREKVNDFIRSGAFDGVIDFAKVVQDPKDPTLIQARFNSGDNLHPNDSGYAAMADAIDLGMLTKAGLTKTGQ